MSSTGWIKDSERRGSLAAKARGRRWDEFSQRFPDLESMRILDLGGTPAAWQSAPRRPEHVVAVNLDRRHHSTKDVRCVVADACALPSALRAERFDLVFSSSLLEHVGGHARRRQFATTVHEMADHHWIQTPYRYFPIEPHWVFPGFQFLPFSVRVAVSQRWKLGHVRARDRQTAIKRVSGVELIGVTEMRSYFPNSEIWFERYAGLVKSLVAIH